MTKRHHDEDWNFPVQTREAARGLVMVFEQWAVAGFYDGTYYVCVRRFHHKPPIYREDAEEGFGIHDSWEKAMRAAEHAARKYGGWI